MENIENTIEKAESKLAEIRAAKKELEQERALANKPVENRSVADKTAIYSDIQKAMLEKRAITVNGTGNVNVMKELFKEILPKKEILKKVRYFYGKDASTVIPVWASDLGRATEVDEAGNFTSSTGQMATKNLQVRAFAKSIPVSDETLKLSAVEFQAELNTIIEDVYAETIAYEIFNAAGTGAFKNIYRNAKETSVKTSGKVTITDLAKFALGIADKTDDAIIILNPMVYADIEASDSSAKEKAWVKELIEKGTIEGVPVMKTSYANAGSPYAVACNPSNYAVAVADQLTIEPKKAIGSLVTTFDCSMYLAGENVVDENVFVLCDGKVAISNKD